MSRQEMTLGRAIEALEARAGGRSLGSTTDAVARSSTNARSFTRDMTSLLCLPVVVCNLGVEMLYVLEQRLRAQSVSDAKAVKVLHDVTRAMFAPEFVNELFTPQPTYSQAATRQIFDKLAHTSIMRLSESSMDKLYDLMTMGFKFQLATCEKPEDILNVTLLHLATLKSYLTEESVVDAVDAVDAELRATYGAFAKHEWLAMRRELFRFLGNKRVKVSLLLHEKLQLEDGRMRLPVSAPDTRDRSVLGPVGTTRRHDISGSEQKRTFFSAVSFDDANAGANKKFAGAPKPEIKPGGNMYSHDRQAPDPPAPIQTLEASERTDGTNSRDAYARDAYGNVRRGNAELLGAADRMAAAAGREKRSGVAEMNALAGLIRAPIKTRGGASAGPSEEDTFKLNLFGDLAGGGTSDGGGGGGGVVDASVLEFGGDAGTGNKASGLTDVMKSFGVEKSPAGASKKAAFDGDASGSESEDDLLALMDGA
jgi:hypothetical protein